ncbi:MAG TPA: hypothetical protein VGJ66_07515 [Pyrinomonadaceae bacterium]|jgi:hypothetical protein
MADKLSNLEESALESSPANPAAIQTTFCGSLRSKKFFMLDAVATDAEQYLDASNHCWCRETQQVIGPDGGRATPDRCTPGRSCYTSSLERA